jgi:hypothetical protein
MSWACRLTDTAFLRNVSGKLDALENATRGVLELAAFTATQSGPPPGYGPTY